MIKGNSLLKKSHSGCSLPIACTIADARKIQCMLEIYIAMCEVKVLHLIEDLHLIELQYGRFHSSNNVKSGNWSTSGALISYLYHQYPCVFQAKCRDPEIYIEKKCERNRDIFNYNQIAKISTIKVSILWSNWYIFSYMLPDQRIKIISQCPPKKHITTL